jgi:hypothetical protein
MRYAEAIKLRCDSTSTLMEALYRYCLYSFLCCKVWRQKVVTLQADDELGKKSERVLVNDAMLNVYRSTNASFVCKEYS